MLRSNSNSRAKLPGPTGTFDYTARRARARVCCAMRLRVLIADDHLEMMTALERLIEPTCEIVGRIADGAEVLDSVAKLLPDLLLVDLNMPGLDGLELCRRTVRAFPAVAVIVLSAEVDASLVQDAREAGAAAFINKLRAAEELPAAITVVRGQR